MTRAAGDILTSKGAIMEIPVGADSDQIDEDLYHEGSYDCNQV